MRFEFKRKQFLFRFGKTSSTQIMNKVKLWIELLFSGVSFDNMLVGQLHSNQQRKLKADLPRDNTTIQTPGAFY